jgi:hypothetical protein
MNVKLWSVDPDASFAMISVDATLVQPQDPDDGTVNESNSQLLAFGFAVGDSLTLPWRHPNPR